MSIKLGTSLQLIDPASGAEMARLSDQHRLLTDLLGGLFCPEVEVSRIRSALEMGCGPGGWVQDVAFTYQDVEVFGVDSCREAIEYARALARVQGLDNAHFQVMDICQPLAFPDDTFDIIRAQEMAADLAPFAWPALLSECKRLLRPGGFIHLVEFDWPDTNSPAAQQLGRIMVQGLTRIGRGYHPEGHRLGALATLVPLLRDAGFVQVYSRTVEAPFTVGLIGLHQIMGQVRKMAYLMGPSLLRWGAVESKELFEQLITKMELEALDQDFHGMFCIGETLGVLV
jgi:SAM-dependent methyltransferase